MDLATVAVLLLGLPFSIAAGIVLAKEVNSAIGGARIERQLRASRGRRAATAGGSGE